MRRFVVWLMVESDSGDVVDRDVQEALEGQVFYAKLVGCSEEVRFEVRGVTVCLAQREVASEVTPE